ncbi:transcriptional repressor TCF25 family protein [Clostridium sardiniense]|uniref:Transcriptional repressor TCF25 family protein n=1 Tax=Clostridium sardiniense TaxID=29369 RepID=A0ABS7KXY9_CLOSR|nr:DUF6398 domain-containing protein [Clostridium sardiniense]MBY0755678.1 transcriptional repressor TCF25 family protein [Clostridium sardiniense]MDQ0462216.1 intracellular sulfur oxidation DsrE/DsrF family protein [Clostridium sardiniense]
MKYIVNVPDELNVRVEEIINNINNFCSKVLDDEYSEICAKLIEVLANNEDNKLSRGKSNTWSAGIVHSIFFVNDTLNKRGLRMDELADFFEVSEGTIGSKSREIRKLLNIDKTSKEWKVKDNKSKCSSCCDSEDSVIDLFDKALNIDDVEKGAIELRKCAVMLNDKLGKEYFNEYKGQIGISAEGDFYLTILSTLSNYEFALGHYEESFRIEKELLELDEYDSRNVRHSIVFRALINKDYEFANTILQKYNEEDCIFFKYAKVLYYYYKNDRKNARKSLKKALKHNSYFIECLVGNIPTIDGEISSYKKGSLEEASLCIEYSLPLWTNQKIGSWLIKAINKIK